MINNKLQLRKIYFTWWPLAASWVLVGLETPLLSAVIARFPDSEINLASYGGIVFPLMLIIQAPIVMLLSASTALCKDWESYLKIRRFMWISGGLLMGLHIFIAFTPAYYILAERIIGAPPEIIESGRIGLMIMTPWTISLAYRRFQQGIMIRFNHSQVVSIGTLVRLIADVTVSIAGILIGGFSGIVVATSAQAVGVLAEGIYAGIKVHPIVISELRNAPAVTPGFSWLEFARFYIPLAINSFISLAWQPLGSAALSRMSMPLQSLAAWPVVSGMVFIFRGFGLAYTETVVALLDHPRSSINLKNFTRILIIGVTGVFLLIGLTPISEFLFASISGLNQQLVEMSVVSFLLSIPVPGLTVLQSLFLGAIIHGKKTSAVPEAMIAFLIVSIIILWAGIKTNSIPGLYVCSFAFSAANAAQAGWLWIRGHSVVRSLEIRDAE